MKKFLSFSLVLALGVALERMFDGAPSRAEAGGGAGGGVEDCATENGDVNADTVIDISDAIAMLGSLFNGDPPALARPCGAGAPSGLPDTGQSACYGIVEGQWVPVPCGEAACAGQDGSHATGCPGDGRFVLNDGGTPEDRSDDTVTDNCTGLMWQRDTADVNADGQSTNQDVIHQWCDALAYCENLSFAGHDDWRLPNVRELQSIVDYGLVGGTSIDPVFGALSVSDSGYWSSVTGVNIYRSSVAWFIDFGIGLVSFNDKVATGRKYVIRAVRPGS
jgi:hypothetical protein